MNMPVTLLIGLPFQIATQCVMDIGNLKCHLNVLGATWKLTMKVPHKKTIRGLDGVVSSPGKRMALTVQAVSPSPNKKVKWDVANYVTTAE